MHLVQNRQDKSEAAAKVAEIENAAGINEFASEIRILVGVTSNAVTLPPVFSRLMLHPSGDMPTRKYLRLLDRVLQRQQIVDRY